MTEQAAKQKTKSKPKVQTVAMVRDAEIYPEPHTADVHPEEVENFSAGGWIEA